MSTVVIERGVCGVLLSDQLGLDDLDVPLRTRLALEQGCLTLTIRGDLDDTIGDAVADLLLVGSEHALSATFAH